MEDMKMDRPFLVGEKVYLRPIDVDDAEGDYLQWINDGGVVRFMDRPFPVSRQSVRDFVQGMIDNPNYVFFAVCEKGTNKHVGNAKIGPIDWIHRRTGFGRMMSRDAWGKKYGTEVVKILVVYIFEQLNLYRVFEQNAEPNIGAWKSNLKAGLEKEGVFKEYLYHGGRYVDAVVVGLTRPQYDEKKKAGLYDAYL